MVPELKPLLEAELGRPMALSSVYNLLHRHGWRRLAPDKHHPQRNEHAQQDWKKLPKEIRCIRRDWAHGVPITLMFQDGAGLGHINDVRRWGSAFVISREKCNKKPAFRRVFCWCLMLSETELQAEAKSLDPGLRRDDVLAKPRAQRVGQNVT